MWPTALLNFMLNDQTRTLKMQKVICKQIYLQARLFARSTVYSNLPMNN